MSASLNAFEWAAHLPCTSILDNHLATCASPQALKKSEKDVPGGGSKEGPDVEPFAALFVTGVEGRDALLLCPRKWTALANAAC